MPRPTLIVLAFALADEAGAAWHGALTPRSRPIVMTEPAETSAITKRSSNDIAIAAGALGAAVVLGADLAALDATAHAEAAIAIGTAVGVAASTDTGALGATLRTVGNLTADLAEAAIGTAARLEDKYDVSTYARATLEVGIEKSLERGSKWRRRRREQKEAAAGAGAESAAPVQSVRKARRAAPLPSVDVRPAARTLSAQRPVGGGAASPPSEPMGWEDARALRTREAFRAVRAGEMRKRAFVRSRLSRWLGRAPAE